jgi:hypothetical protein
VQPDSSLSQYFPGGLSVIPGDLKDDLCLLGGQLDGHA